MKSPKTTAKIVKQLSRSTTRPDWNGWRLHTSTRELVHPRASEYGVDLERMTSSAETLDWIFQLSGKTWVTNEMLGGLVRAIRDLLEPQATLCSFGEERGPLNIKKQLAKWPERVAEYEAFDELDRLGKTSWSVSELFDPIGTLQKLQDQKLRAGAARQTQIPELPAGLAAEVSA